MDDIYGIRRQNLRLLLGMPPLSKQKRQVDQATALDMSASMLSQIKHPDYRMGDEIARKLEGLCGMPANWMDNTAGNPAHSEKSYSDTGISVATLSDALAVLEASEAISGLYPPVRRAEIILELCSRLDAGESPLTLVAQLSQQRRTGEKDESSGEASRRRIAG